MDIKEKLITVNCVLILINILNDKFVAQKWQICHFKLKLKFKWLQFCKGGLQLEFVH